MKLRVLAKTVFPMFAMGMIMSLLSNDVFAEGGWGWGRGEGHHGHGEGHHGGAGHHGGGGSSGGGSVPEIGTGSAGCALALLVGGAYLLKDRFFGRWSHKTRQKGS